MSSTLGEFLRARREQTRPEDAGVRVTGVRRTPGLRREEVATLAGISADYYLRLEQGRDLNPSVQVLESVARVFRLDATATEYLLGLAGSRHQRHRPQREVVPTRVLQFLDAIGLPAFVEGRTFDVLAANPMATAVIPSLVPGRNRLRSVFLENDEWPLYEEGMPAFAGLVAALRTSAMDDPADPRLTELVAELSAGSDEFRRMWARHDVVPLGGGSFRLRHPVVGLLELSREKFPLTEAPGQILAVYHAERGSETARSLSLLGSLSAAPVE
ncbi:helix-turn-helix transcriptional regulator [Kineosporia sp. NBRC 101731]|uniref:helix-turn-helix domain-containing protein n=1 Tax=Kineosporia sp. NBRC 101731 TaxID=3032199 RepID=UPI0024A0D5EB|nr:helix-turn-helix transcriptional regulator [Kineosporia sp. NBRC 101731]GLY30222.1 transcriptional regulator [Kineosporia sp. NBRC 101731]